MVTFVTIWTQIFFCQTNHGFNNKILASVTDTPKFSLNREFVHLKVLQSYPNVTLVQQGSLIRETVSSLLYFNRF